MPFKSEKQRRYLWANEPEIARDWTETYGSRIEKNIGGIMRVPFRFGGGYQGREANPGPAGGASTGGNYGGNRSGGVSPNQMSGARPFTRDRPNPYTISGTSKDTFVSPSTISTSPQFTQEGRDTFIQNLRGPTLGQRFSQGIKDVASRVGDFYKQGGVFGAASRGLASLFGSGWNTTMGPRQDMGYNPNRVNPFFTPERDPREGGDISIPLWAQLGYPSYEAFLISQNQGIRGIEGINIDETEVDDFVQRFRLPDEYRQNPYTVDTPIKYT